LIAIRKHSWRSGRILLGHWRAGPYCIPLCPQHQLNANRQVEVLIFLESDVSWCAPVEDGERELVGVLDWFFQFHDGMDTFDDLATEDACFWEARAEEEDVAFHATRLESTFDVLDE